MQNWTSKFQYRYDEKTFGYITRKADEYFIGKKLIDAKWARSIFVAESARAGRGRPALYPLDKCKLVGISLPQRLWDKVGKPYSKNIGDLIEGMMK